MYRRYHPRIGTLSMDLKSPEESDLPEFRDTRGAGAALFHSRIWTCPLDFFQGSRDGGGRISPPIGTSHSANRRGLWAGEILWGAIVAVGVRVWGVRRWSTGCEIGLAPLILIMPEKWELWFGVCGALHSGFDIETLHCT
jgi:hypothetical protein